MPNPTVKFSEYWDKFDDRAPGARFKTHRLFSEAKRDYYTGLGKRATLLDITIQGRVFGTAKVVLVGSKMSADMTDYDIKVDTHQHWTRKEWDELMKKFYGSTDIKLLVIELEWVEIKVGHHKFTILPVGLTPGATKPFGKKLPPQLEVKATPEEKHDS